ncbi:hypothetical protein ACQ664_001160 [Enterococcus faecalis]
MADIVQLKENGVVKYMKTHADAIDGVEGKLVKAVGNETVLGTKNFQDGVQIGGKIVTADRIWRTAYENWGEGFYCAASENRDLGEFSKISQVILLIGRYTGAGNDERYAYSEHSFNFPQTRLGTFFYQPLISYDGGSAASSIPEVALKKIKFANVSGRLRLQGDDYNLTNSRSKGYTVKAVYVLEKA